jgi:NTP pyrophosphatase (non-canonical NTP hydrolase)
VNNQSLSTEVGEEKFDILVFQKWVVEWNKKNFGEHYGTGYRLLLGCMEELGELSHAHLKGEQGIRHTPEEILHLKKDAIGDIVVFLLNYCDSQNIDILECLQIVWDTLKQRDWKNSTLSGEKR